MRMGPMDFHPQMSPPGGFMPPVPMMPGPNDMPPMRPGPGHMGPNMGRGWGPPDGPMESPDFSPIHNRMMLPDDRFGAIGARRLEQQQQMMAMQGLSPHGPGPLLCEAPRYTKWRERRDVITNLDRETAQSSSRTDSLKSSLQQDSRVVNKGDKSNRRSNAGSHKPGKQQSGASKSSVSETAGQATSASAAAAESAGGEPGAPKATVKTESQEISDGEIIDDEDSSDDSDVVQTNTIRLREEELSRRSNYPAQQHKGPPAGGNRGLDSHQYYEASGKKRRLLDREDYSMDYETISDEDLDDFMGDKKLGSTDDRSDGKLDDSRTGTDGSGKSLSEVELLNALGLDWANLVEMARQSRANKEFSSPGFGLSRFQVSNYLPQLGITADLAGPKLYDLVQSVCRSC